MLTYIFIAELVLKHVAMGFIRYWTDAWNILDGFIVAVSIADLIVVATGGSKTGTQVGSGGLAAWAGWGTRREKGWQLAYGLAML